MPMRRFTMVVVIGIGLLGVACAIYAAHMIRGGFSTRRPPSGLEEELAMTMRDMAIPARYKTMKNPIAPTPEVVHAGMNHFADHCAICHANNGSGETMFGRSMYPRPPALGARGTQSMSDGEIYYTIQNGVRLSGMPAFGEQVDDDADSWRLVAFIRHLPKLTAREEIEMSRLNLKAPDEQAEEKQEQDFLNGSSSSKAASSTHKDGKP